MKINYFSNTKINRKSKIRTKSSGYNYNYTNSKPKNKSNQPKFNFSLGLNQTSILRFLSFCAVVCFAVLAGQNFFSGTANVVSANSDALTNTSQVRVYTNFNRSSTVLQNNQANNSITELKLNQIPTPVSTPNPAPSSVTDKPNSEQNLAPKANEAETAKTATPENTLTEETEAELPTRIKDDLDVYVVRSGDTLYGISLRFKIPLATLAQLNNLEAPYELSVGQKIVLK